MKFWMPDNRRTDMDNKCASILDLLVDNFHIPDDAWQETGPIHLIPMGIDKLNPRVIISWI